LEIEIAPEPDAAERRALLDALEGLEREPQPPPAYRSLWRRAALEAAEDEGTFG